jgi:hypothetical protein
MAGPSRTPGVAMTDDRWKGALAISTCWEGATAAEAWTETVNVHAERIHDLREPRTTPATEEPARAAAGRA